MCVGFLQCISCRIMQSHIIGANVVSSHTDQMITEANGLDNVHPNRVSRFEDLPERHWADLRLATFSRLHLPFIVIIYRPKGHSHAISKVG